MSLEYRQRAMIKSQVWWSFSASFPKSRRCELKKCIAPIVVGGESSVRKHFHGQGTIDFLLPCSSMHPTSRLAGDSTLTKNRRANLNETRFYVVATRGSVQQMIKRVKWICQLLATNKFPRWPTFCTNICFSHMYYSALYRTVSPVSPKPWAWVWSYVILRFQCQCSESLEKYWREKKSTKQVEHVRKANDGWNRIETHLRYTKTGFGQFTKTVNQPKSYWLMHFTCRRMLFCCLDIVLRQFMSSPWRCFLSSRIKLVKFKVDSSIMSAKLVAALELLIFRHLYSVDSTTFLSTLNFSLV